MLKSCSVLGLAGLMMLATPGLRAEGFRDASPGVAPDQAWHMLTLGNGRFAEGLSLRPHQDAQRRREQSHRQRPWAVVVADSDSRVVPTILFDLGLGDLYVVRDAACVLKPGPALDSVEYAVGHLGVRLVVVLGNSGSGVIPEAVDGARRGALGRLASDCAPALAKAQDKLGGLSGDALKAAAVEQNVLLEMKRVLEHSDLIAAKVKAGDVKVIGGIYNLETGRVRWLGENPSQAAILAGRRP